MKTITSIFFITLFLFVACKETIEEMESASLETQENTIVEVQNVELTNDPIPIFAIGRFGSDEEVKLSFKIGGIVSSISADEGQYVKEGTQLATLRTTEIDAQVLKAQQALQKAQRDLDRIQNMYKDGAATLENVQDLTTLVQVSTADLDVVRFNQQYAKIISPVSGRILHRSAENGELVGPGQPIFIVSSTQKSQLLKASLSDRDVARINYGDKARIHFDAFPNELFNGKVLRVSESSDPRTGTFEVDIQIDARGKRMRNGYIGRVEILPLQVESYYKVPLDALVEGNEEEVTIFLLQEEGNTAKEIKVRPDFIGEDYFTVSRANNLVLEKVITSGAPYLRDNDKIQIKASN
jgi:RND family efflux transporter MFP subunit